MISTKERMSRPASNALCLKCKINYNSSSPWVMKVLDTYCLFPRVQISGLLYVVMCSLACLDVDTLPPLYSSKVEVYISLSSVIVWACNIFYKFRVVSFAFPGVFIVCNNRFQCVQDGWLLWLTFCMFFLKFTFLLAMFHICILMSLFFDSDCC